MTVAIPDRSAVAVTERDVVDGWIFVLGDVASLADRIAQTEFVPKALRGKPAAIAACMLTGREIGIGPMQSMKVIHMVQGSPSLSAEFKRARALERGHEIVFEETTTTRCTVRGRRRGEDSWVTVSWTIDDAKRAGLLGKDVWRAHPRRMLEARASSELCDLKFPDCSWGLPTTEVLEDGGMVLEDGTITDVADAKAIEAPKPATAQRASRRQKPERPTAAAPAAASEPTTAPATAATAPAADLPPLPGEDEQPDDSRHRKLVGIVRQHFKRIGFKEEERDQRLAVTATIAGTPPIESTSDLPDDRLSAVADTLARCRDRERLITLLAAGEQDAEGEAGDGS